MNEAQTRHDLIDPALKAAGWNVVQGSRIKVEVITAGRIIGKDSKGNLIQKKPLSCDYVLEYNGQRLAVIEAKARDKFYTDGLAQAKAYALRLNTLFAYSTNGLESYGVYMDEGTEGDVSRFPSSDELWEMCFPTPIEDNKIEIEDWKDRFGNVPLPLVKGQYLPRYYQRTAVEKCLQAIANKQDRLLLTMATGTGKTATAFHLCWKLFQAKWNLQRNPNRSPRTLFLADRNILADQAFNAFEAFDNIDTNIRKRISPAEIRKTGHVPKNGGLFFTIFQSLVTTASTGEEVEEVEEENSLLAAEPLEALYSSDETIEIRERYLEYPEDFFDLIIIDECHRGGANDESSWRAILDYFSPAVQLGLTATPKRTGNTNTYNYFGDPVYSYTLKEGINDGFLTPFKLIPIVGTMDEYVYTPGDGEVIKGEPEPGRVYKEGDFNRVITIPAREEKRVRYWMDRFNPKEKTIVFCATQEHAGMVRDYINQYAVEKDWTSNSNYCVRVTANDGAAGDNDLKTFQDNEKTIPTILTTSRKLSTGVDARNVRNIVLMRPCNNMIEFKQIIGRGTRMYDGKDYFTIYDFVKAHYNFADPEWDGEPLEAESCKVCNNQPCSCTKEPCEQCGFNPC